MKKKNMVIFLFFWWLVMPVLGWCVSPGEVIWTFYGDSFQSSGPAISPDGTIYVDFHYGNLYALSSGGSELWMFSPSGNYHSDSPPTIGEDGTIYFGSNDGYFYALNPDGSEKWRFNVGVEIKTSPAIGEDGTIYFGAGSYLYALDKYGNEKWHFITPQPINSSPAIGKDGTIYFGSDYYNLYALNPDGTQRWFFRTNGVIFSSPAIGEDGTIYFGSVYYFYALNPDGTEKWRFYSGESINSSPVIGEDGTIYFYSDNGLHALNPDGTQKWVFAVQNQDGGWASPLIGDDGTIYITSFDALHAINPDGSEKWTFYLPDSSDLSASELVMDSKGIIYLGGRFCLYAIETSSSGPAHSPWPMFQRNARHTGMADQGPIISSFTATPQTGNVPLQVSFRCDSYGTSVFKWDFDGDGNIDRETQWITSRVANTATYTYNEPGTYNATVTVVDGKGNTDTSSVVITVNSVNQGPEIGSCVANPQNGTAPLNVNFTCSGSDPDGYIQEYRWDFDGDGNVDTTTPSDQLTSNVSENYIYNNTGVYNATITLVDNSGNTATTSITITVNPGENYGPAINSLIASPDSGFAPLGVLFTCIVGDGVDVYNYLWDFDGDGNIDETTTDYTTYYTYNSTGVYNATVIVEDINGLQSSASVTITVTNSQTSITPGSEKWSFQTAYFVHSSPAIGEDGTIYFGSRDNNFYAINPDGTMKWIFQTGDEIFSSPAIGEDGTIYFGSTDHNFYALNPDGSLKWEFQTGDAIFSSPAMGEDGTIYFGSRDGNLYALNSAGTLMWSVHVGYTVDSSSVIGSDGTIYMGSTDSITNFYAFAPDGSVKWEVPIEGGIKYSPSIGEDNTIYFGTLNGKFYALNPDGTEKWTYTTSNAIYSSPVIGEDGTIYFGSEDGNFYAMNPDGSVKWTFSFQGGDWDYSSPVIGQDGTIYLVSINGKLYALNPDGTEKWSSQISSLVYSSPAIDSSGTIYFGSYYDHKLHAINSGSDGLADSPWPMFHRNLRHTGRADQEAVNQRPMVSYFNAYPTSGYGPLSVYFDCVANDIDGNIVLYKWDFDGDGNIDETTTYGGISYSYNSSGTYNATVVVQDDKGLLSEPSYILINVLERQSCDEEHLTYCTNQEECEGAGGYWFNNDCIEQQPPRPLPDDQIIEEVENGAQNGMVLVGNVVMGGNTMKLELNFPQYESGVDIYVGVMIPGMGLMVLQPNGTLGTDIAPYKTNTLGPVKQIIIPEFSICSPITNELIIPPGEYTIYSMVVPAGASVDLVNGFYELSYYSFDVLPEFCI